MEVNPSGNLQAHLVTCRAQVNQSKAEGNPRHVCLALSDLGMALFAMRHFDDGLAAFDEMERMASTLDDVTFQVHCLGLWAAAYQDIGRFHNAYEIIEKVVQLADQHEDIGMKCDALVTQGQILINSGEPIEAVKKLGNLVRSVHCKDGTWSDQPGETWGAEVALGEGDVNMKAYLTTLKEIGYLGPLTIEREIPQDPVRQKAEIGQAIELLEALRSEILG